MNADDLTPNPPLPSLQFTVVRHQADGGCPALGLVLLALVMMAAAVVVGAVAGFLAQWFYLVLLSPIAIGFGVGLAGYWAVGLGRVRAAGVAALVGCAAGVAAMFTLHYLGFHRAMAELEQANPQLHQLAVANGFGFFDFMDARATEGVRLSRAGGGGKDGGMNLGYVGSYIYWGIELIIVVALTAMIPAVRATEPYCTRCSTWKQPRVLGVLGIDPGVAVEIFNEGNVGALVNLEKLPAGGPIQVKAIECPQCKGETNVEFAIETVTVGENGGVLTKELVKLTYPGEALKVFETLLQQQEPPPPELPPAPA